MYRFMRLFLVLIPFLPNYLNATSSFDELEKSKVRQKIFHQGFNIDESYKAFNGQGISYDLKNVIVSVSAFTLSEGKYTFAFNQEAVLDLTREEQKVSNTIPAIPPAAVAIALLVEGEPQFTGGVGQRRLITSLNDHIFQFKDNIRPTDVTLLLSNHSQDNGEWVDRSKVSMSLRITLDGEHHFYESLSNFNASDVEEYGSIVPSGRASHVTSHSAATSDDSFNLFWREVLNNNS